MSTAGPGAVPAADAPDTDVCVVGGGPAGLVLALLLLKSGVRVTLVERSRAHHREFRGEILQPGAMRLLDELGVLAGARARGCHEHDRFRLVEGERVLLDIDYRTLPAPYDHLLSIPQPHLLDELVLHCAKFDAFTHLEGHRASALLHGPGGEITGVCADGPEGRREIRAHVTVAADGRFSKLRRLAGIEAGRSDVFDLDVLWFKLSVPDSAPGRRDVRVFRHGASPVLAYDSYPDKVQIGWTLPHGGYADLAGRGVEHLKDQLAAAAPPYAELIREQITSFKDVSLLDVFSGRADRWAVDGLVCIGDAAHTHSPIGAQGINLAVQDAVALHPLLITALAEGDASAAFLGTFEARRAPDIAAVMRTQRVQSAAMLGRGVVATRVRPALAALLRRTPLYGKVLRHIAYGNPDIRVAKELFTDGA
ncbi:FAD-dependent monooxygenase [Streptomyces sp. L2]|uniref:FAD-dependent monooxygenase n=1 Tax=Streptomyces sp. L2 TaxID=2162665 RepID=UPI00101076E9|nr:FAD-dependent monooxygenase [Streptomyces sp. L2]